MELTAQMLLRLALSCVLLFSLIGVEGARLATPFEVANKDCSGDYLCGCQAVPGSEHGHLVEFFHQPVDCKPWCAEQTCYQTCEKSACVTPMGSGGQWCAALVDQSMVDYVRGATCILDHRTRMQKCIHLTSVTYPDDQTHKAITQGYCIPICGLDVGAIQCTFEGRFRDTRISHSMLPTPPFTVITGVGFKHLSEAKMMTTHTHTETVSHHTGQGSSHFSSSSHTSSHSSISPETATHETASSKYEESASLVSTHKSATASVECPDDVYLCGCQAVPATQQSLFNELFHQNVECTKLCGQEECYQTCEKSACATQMGSSWCAGLIEQAMVDFVRSSNCIYDAEMRMYECVSGGSITYADEQTYKAITEGYCVPTCELDVGSIQCTFEGRFMDSYIYEYDLPHSPFTVITGVDFKHRDKMTARQPIANAEDASAQNAYISQTAGASSAYRIQDLDRSASLLQSGSGIASTACSESDTLLCGCQAIERSEESRLEDFLRQSVQCDTLCAQTSCHQTCEQSACIRAMGTLGEWCAGLIDQAMVDFVRSATCSYDQGMRMYKCVKGGSVTYPDGQTYMAITEGYCIPTCGLSIDSIRCTFPGRFRDTSIYELDRPKPPFTIITGLDFQHWESTTTTEVTETTHGEEEVEHEAEETEVTTHEATEETEAEATETHEASEQTTEETETVIVTEEPSKEPKGMTKEFEKGSTKSKTTVTKISVEEVIQPEEEEPSHEEAETTEEESKESSTIRTAHGKTARTKETTEEATTEETTVEVVPSKKEGKIKEKKAEVAEETTESEGESKESVGRAATKEEVTTEETVEVAEPVKVTVKGKKKKAKETEETTESEESESKTGTEEEETTEATTTTTVATATTAVTTEPIEEEESEEAATPERKASRRSKETKEEQTTTTTTVTTEPEEEEESEEAATPQRKAIKRSEQTKEEQTTATTTVTTLSTEETEESESTETESVGIGEGEEETVVATEETTESTERAEEEPALEAVAPANDNQLYYGPFGECSQVCSEAGASYKERSIVCRNHAGIPVALNECDLPENLNEEFFEECETQKCGPGFYIHLTYWSECEKKCAAVMFDGTALPNKKTRDYECRRVRGDAVVGRERCADLVAELGVSLRSTCNSVPCSRYAYQVDEWGDCDCATWTQTRTVTCVRLSDNTQVEDSMCDAFRLEPPAAEQRCFPQQCFEADGAGDAAEVDYCQFSTCSQRGDCEDGQCQCDFGFDGPDCQQDDRSRPECAPPSLFHKDGDCCESGVFDSNGICCKGTNDEVGTDIRGKCCRNKSLDGCGVCMGKNPKFLDSANQCCEVLDASGTCCSSGNVDECGVCDGSGSSCRSKIDFQVKVSRNQDFDACGNELASILMEAFELEELTWTKQARNRRLVSFSKRDVDLSSGYLWHKVNLALEDKSMDEFCDVEAVKTSKVPICGNGICEIGEPENCVRDCDYGIQLCEKQRGRLNEPVMCNGHGLCSIKTAECVCFSGYEGKNCEKCGNGFFHVGDDGRCIMCEAFVNRPSFNAYAM